MEKRKARVRYTKMAKREGYAVEIYSDGEWCLDTFYPLINSLINCDIISDLSRLKDCGYDVHYVKAR